MFDHIPKKPNRDWVESVLREYEVPIGVLNRWLSEVGKEAKNHQHAVALITGNRQLYTQLAERVKGFATQRAAVSPAEGVVKGPGDGGESREDDESVESGAVQDGALPEGTPTEVVADGGVDHTGPPPSLGLVENGLGNGEGVGRPAQDLSGALFGFSPQEGNPGALVLSTEGMQVLDPLSVAGIKRVPLEKAGREDIVQVLSYLRGRMVELMTTRLAGRTRHYLIDPEWLEAFDRCAQDLRLGRLGRMKLMRAALETLVFCIQQGLPLYQPWLGDVEGVFVPVIRHEHKDHPRVSTVIPRELANEIDLLTEVGVVKPSDLAVMAVKMTVGLLRLVQDRRGVR